jgi:hypothetical protein
VQEVKESGFKISCCYPKLEAFFIRRIDSGIKRSSSTSLRTPESGSHPGPWFGCGEHFEPLPVIQPARSLFTHLSWRAFIRLAQRKSGSISNDRDPSGV